MEKRYFGTLPSGASISLYTIRNEVASLSVMELGGRIVKFETYGKDIVGGFDNLSDYLKDTSYQGAVIGRVANRIANAKFEMNGKEYNLTANENRCCLHGGVGFDFRIWTVEKTGEDFITLSYLSVDGEGGFPSELLTLVTYRLCGSALLIDFKAYPKGKTPIALTNHSYFNLNSFQETVDNHLIRIYADRYTAVDENLIPTGERPLVDGTAFDLRATIRIGERLSSDFVGYNINFILNDSPSETVFGKKLRLAAEVIGRELSMKVYTDQPCVQFYMCDFTDKCPAFRGGHRPIINGSFCLETQTEPNCVNLGKAFYKANEVYTHSTVYKVLKL